MYLVGDSGCIGFWVDLIVVQNNEIVASALTGYKLFREISLTTGSKLAFPPTDWRARNVDIEFTIKQNKHVVVNQTAFLLAV